MVFAFIFMNFLLIFLNLSTKVLKNAKIRLENYLLK